MSVSSSSLSKQLSGCGLLACEAHVVGTVLGRRLWQRGLALGTLAEAPGALPRVARQVSLTLAGPRWVGDVKSPADAALPFFDDSFALIVVSHVLECTGKADALLEELVRVLEPNGTLVVTGYHPFSPWLPWLLCRRRPRPMLTAPGWLHQRLALRGVTVAAVHRCGGVWPGARVRGAGGAWGGGFVLVARKHRAAVRPLRAAPAARYRVIGAGWMSETHRECA